MRVNRRRDVINHDSCVLQEYELELNTKQMTSRERAKIEKKYEQVYREMKYYLQREFTGYSPNSDHVSCTGVMSAEATLFNPSLLGLTADFAAKQFALLVNAINPDLSVS